MREENVQKDILSFQVEWFIPLQLVYQWFYLNFSTNKSFLKKI